MNIMNPNATRAGSLLGNGMTLKQFRDGILERTAKSGHYNGLKKLELRESDPIRYEKLFSKLRGGLVHARETAKKIAASPIVEQEGELCFTLYNPAGDCVLTSTGIIIHVGTMGAAIKYMIENDWESNPGINPGDMFTNNDCAIGNVHPCDIATALDEVLGKAQRIGAQSAQRKAIDGEPKLYAWHAPEVDCISKGKARRPYEFGVKVGIASTFKGNLIVGARAFHRNPYDGHTLSSQLEQATILMQDCAAAPETVFVDLGYRGVDADNPGVRVVHRGKPKRLTAQERRQLKRRQAIEPMIGHLKADHRMDRCHLKGEYGDRLHAVLCAAGYNIKWLLRMIAKKGVPFLRAIFCASRKARCHAGSGRPWPRAGLVTA